MILGSWNKSPLPQWLVQNNACHRLIGQDALQVAFFSFLHSTETSVCCRNGGLFQNHMPEYFLQLGNHAVWGDARPFVLTPEARRHHTYVIGKTGTGKTTLLRNMIVQDISVGHGVAVIDPHGDLAKELLDCIPSWRTNHVCYFNPADIECPIGLNLLQKVPPIQRPRVASGVVGMFKGIWRDSWGPRMEYILYATIAALLDCENVTLLAVPRMLTDENFRDWVVRQVKDPVVKNFWVNEFALYDKKFVQEVIAPIQNKVGQFLMAAPIRNIVGQVKSKIDARFMMDNKRIFIANLAKGQLGEDKSNLLGAMLVTQFQLAAMGRADIPETQREDFHLYIDEFQNFTTDSFASILSEARKYKLCLTVGHQYTSQLNPVVRDAIFGNVGTMASFRVSHTDAEALSKQYGDAFPPARFTDLPNHETLIRPMAENGYGGPFPAKNYPPIKVEYHRGHLILQASRQRFSAPRALIEKKIHRWLQHHWS
jgi:hypothetical protein